jgi:argininosuccinate lyase
MPQKRNPVALEHGRALASKALGQATAITAAVHNTPFGDIVDTEDDLQPLVSRMFADASRAVALVAAAMERATFDVAALAARANQGWITVTELADTLSRDHGLPFKAGHAIASQLIARAQASPDASVAALLRDAAKAVGGVAIEYTDAQLSMILSPRHFVEVRKTHGGPAPSETRRASAVSEGLLAGDDEWLSDTRADLARVEEELRSASSSI